MAVIREELTLADKFSGALDRYIKKMEQAVERTGAGRTAADRMAESTGQMASRMRDSINENQALYQSEARLSGVTGDLVRNLSGLETAVRGAFTDGEADAALKRLQREMERTGLVWTNEADRMEAADLLARNGLQQLAAEGRITASAMAEEAAAAEQAAAAQERHEARVSKLTGVLSSMTKGAKSAVASLLGFNGAKNPIDSLNNRLSRTVLYFFSVRKLIRYVTDAIERAPDETAGSFSKMKSMASDAFARTVVSALEGMQSGVDRLNASLESEAGQKFMRGLERTGQAAGAAVGFLMDKAANLVEWMGNNYQTVMTVAAVATGLLAGKMLATAAATAAANLPLIMLVGLSAALVVGLQEAGVTSEEIFAKIGSGAGWLYALGYNLVADAWNLFATFAEFFANVFNDPVAAVAHLFFDTFDAILGVVETTASAIDALTGSNLASAVSGFRSKMQSWVDNTFGENEIKIDRMEKISYESAMASGAEKAMGLANSFADFSLSDAVATSIKNISDDVNSIKKSVSLSEEDIKSLVDMAERKYVNNINLTTQAPVISVQGQNTGDTAADRQYFADVLRDILLEQTASGSVRSTAQAF